MNQMFEALIGTAEAHTHHPTVRQKAKTPARGTPTNASKRPAARRTAARR